MAYFFQNQVSPQLILHFYIFTCLHGGELSGSESGVVSAFFIQIYDLRRLISIFTWGSAHVLQNMGSGWLFLSKISSPQG